MTVKIDGTNTVANPAFTGADTDTGLQCGTNELKLVTGGTARATVDSSGRLGINTTSLVSKFTIDNGGRADPSSTGSTTQSNAAFEINADSESNTRLMAGMSTGSKFWMQVQNNVGDTADDILLNPIGGNVSVGNTNPSDYASGANNLVVGDTSSANGITILTGTGNAGGLNFADGTGGTDRGRLDYDHGDDRMRFYTASTERVRIHSGGTVSISGGIELGSGLDGTSSNTLDDYEEGDFTPTYSSGITNPSYTGTGGHYTKIGRLVTFTIRIRATGTNSSGHLRIDNLPFPSNSNNEGSVSFGYTDNMNAGDGILGHIPTGTSKVEIYQFSGSNFNGNNGNGVSGRVLHLRGFYYTDS